MTTIDLPATLTAHVAYKYEADEDKTVSVVALHFGGYEVTTWPVDKVTRDRLADNPAALQEFVAGKLAELFRSTP